MQTRMVYEKIELKMWRLLIPLMDDLKEYSPRIQKIVSSIKSMNVSRSIIVIAAIALSGLLVGFLSAILLGLS